MEFDPLSEEFFENPWEMFRWLRDDAPAYHNEKIGFWAVSRYHDCVDLEAVTYVHMANVAGPSSIPVTTH